MFRRRGVNGIGLSADSLRKGRGQAGARKAVPPVRESPTGSRLAVATSNSGRAAARDLARNRGIEKAFTRNAALDAEDLQISVNDDTVTLTGTVSSWAEHHEALKAAWAAAGINSVRDYIRVAY
jgi:osmotically-inducible protein OsmY